MADRLVSELIDRFSSPSPQEITNNAITKISDTINELNKNAQLHEDTINNEFDAIITNINAKKKELLAKLRNITDSKKNKLLHQQKILSQKWTDNKNQIRLSTNSNILLLLNRKPINNAISNFVSIEDGYIPYIPKAPSIQLISKNYYKAVIKITNNEDETDTDSHIIHCKEFGDPQNAQKSITEVINMQNNNNKCIEYELINLDSDTKYILNVHTRTSTGLSPFSAEIIFKTFPTPVWLNYNEEKEEKKMDLEALINTIVNSIEEPTQEIQQLINRLQKLNLPLNHKQYDMITYAVEALQSLQMANNCSWHLVYELFSVYKTFRKKYKSAESVRDFDKIGLSMYIDKYPQSPHKDIKYEQRLVDIFGMPYRNKLWLETNENKWNNSHNKMLLSSSNWYSNNEKNLNNLHVQFLYSKCINRGFAINARNGWVVSVSLNNMYVFKPNGSCFKLETMLKFSDACGCPVLSEIDNINGRVRFVNNDIYLFVYSIATIYKFVLNKNINNKCVIELRDTKKNKYFRDSRTVDIVVTDKLLILLFDRWLGVYQLYPKLQWYHAIGFAKRSVVAHSFEMSYFDDTVEIINFNKQDKFLRETNINYAVISASNQMIAIHPTNPTFHFVHIAGDIKPEIRFCVSKRYGVFYLNDNGKCIFQSSHLQSQLVRSIVCIKHGKLHCDGDMMVSMKPLDSIEQICNVVYDEMYGISGRLLITVRTSKNEYFVQQLCNYMELIHFADESNKIDYYSVPGIVIVYVYNILYGDNVIQTLLRSHANNRCQMNDH
eukprot:304398_1